MEYASGILEKLKESDENSGGDSSEYDSEEEVENESELSVQFFKEENTLALRPIDKPPKLPLNLKTAYESLVTGFNKILSENLLQTDDSKNSSLDFEE